MTSYELKDIISKKSKRHFQLVYLIVKNNRENVLPF